MLHSRALSNLQLLRQNPYPGRGLVVGMNDTGFHMVQAYWIMGRSENSRNRVFVSDDNYSLRTAPADASKVKDPRLIIYNAMRRVGNIHVVSNGDQTDAVVLAYSDAKPGDYVFFDVLSDREYEDDAPNFTPRITAMSVYSDGYPTTQISVLRKSRFSHACDHLQYSYEEMGNGLGYCVTTYTGDGNPLPSFEGEPYLLPLQGDIQKIAEKLWSALDESNRVALAVKFIDVRTDVAEIHIINKYQAVSQ